MSAFNSEDESFVTIFPARRRIYLFDLFGVLREKFQSHTQPLCIAWNEERREYLIGFDDHHIGRFNTRLDGIGVIPLANQLEPRRLACSGDNIYVNDLSEQIICLDGQGNVRHQINLGAKVSHFLYVNNRNYLIVSISDCILALDPSLQTLWTVKHFGGDSVAAYSTSGDLWVALASGHLWRLSGDGQKLLDVAIPPNVRSLAVLKGLVVLGTIKGELLLYNKWGQKLGNDNIGVPLYHICATASDLLVLSTAKGPTVVKPRPELLLRNREQIFREQALETLLKWEAAAKSDTKLRQVLGEHLGELDLTYWQKVYALQLQFGQRRDLHPALYKKIETVLHFLDPQKAVRICTKTVPVIIDGSNVSRYHWRSDKEKTKKQARLELICSVRDNLAGGMNPVYYPLIIVVDASERRYTDDPPGLKRMIDSGEILEAPSAREADALILNLIRTNEWQNECRIVSNDRRLFNEHRVMLPMVSDDWYEQVRMAFTINPKTLEVYFPERSAR
jgi:hypothetical protein